jgi:hypothetical protein
LSSPLFLISIGYLARKLQYRISPAEDRDLRRWFYIANARAHYSGLSETTLDADLALIDGGGSAPELLESLRQEIGRFEIEPADVAGRGQRSALFSTAYLALKSRGAKDWRTRLALSLTHSGRYHFIEYHHIFPKAALRGHYDKSEINEMANMAFVSGSANRRMGSTPAERTLADVRDQQGEQALIDHCIPLDPELWKVENYRAFLEYRRAALAKAINEFIGGRMDQTINVDVDDLIAGSAHDYRFRDADGGADSHTRDSNQLFGQTNYTALDHKPFTDEQMKSMTIHDGRGGKPGNRPGYLFVGTPPMRDQRAIDVADAEYERRRGRLAAQWATRR